MVHMNEVSNLMDKMMKVDIFHPSEKLRMLEDEEKTFLDPNLIMDERHRVLRENSSASSANGYVLSKAKKLLTQEETMQLYMKKQQRYLERELKRFEIELSKSRPKFVESSTCRRRNFAPSDDEDFWRATRKLRHKMVFERKPEQTSDNRERSVDTIRTNTESDDFALKAENEKNWKKGEGEVPCIGSIKVTITDKNNFETETQRLHLLRKYFDILKRYAAEKQRLRDIKTKIQRNMIAKTTRKYFDLWRTRTKDAKVAKEAQKEIEEISEERRIEMFINAITERQKELMRTKQPKIRDCKPAIKESNDMDTRKKNTCLKRVIVESPAQSRLNAQKQIIEKQKAKLAEQNRIIEELKLKQMQKEISRANKETVDIAKETLTHCGRKTRRTLIQLMQQNGYRNLFIHLIELVSTRRLAMNYANFSERDESLTVPPRPPDPPKFLLRMEARAEARRERVKLAEESRRQKLEEQKRKEEAARIEEEQKKRRLQQEALAEARRSRREQEQNQQREVEKLQRLNNMADEFYRKYLLRRFIMKPFAMLLEEKRNNIKKADNHCREKLTRKIFETWRREAETRCKMKANIAVSFCNKNLTRKMFAEWKQLAKERNSKYQVAIDFHDMKLLEKYFKLWRVTSIELKEEHEEKERLANDIYEYKLKAKYLGTWKKYLTIVADIKESEKRRDELRQLVQKVIPDFNPKQRGVALED